MDIFSLKSFSLQITIYELVWKYNLVCKALLWKWGKLMKLRRIIAGVTACTVVASTMLAMPISAKTTTRIEKITLADLLNGAKMVVQLTDDIKAEKQAELLDKFDTNGNGKISIDEVLSIARRIARTDESDIVNEHGTADSEETTTAETTLTEDTTTTAETTETTAVETTETTEETTTATEAVVFAPVLKIGGTEYRDGDKFIAETGGIYSVEVTDAENEITFSLAGSKDNEDNNLVRVSESNFEVLADGTLTVTVKASDGQEKTITLNVVTEKHIEGLTDFYIGFSYSDSGMSNEYYETTLERYELYFENGMISEEDFNSVKLLFEVQNKFGDMLSVSSIMEIPYVGDEIQITDFLKLNEDNTVEPYGITDKVTYKSSDESKVYASEDGKIVAKGVTTEPVEILMFVDGKVVNRFKATVEKEQSERILTDTSARIIAGNNFGAAVESKYIDGVNSGIVLSLNELKNAVGEENVNYISYRKADGTNLKFTDNFISNAEQFAKDNGLLMFIDESNTTIYYAMTNPQGYINTKIPLNDSNGTLFEKRIEILDMEQFRKYYNSLNKSEALTVNIKGVKATAKDSTEMTADGTVYLTEGETLSLSDIVKVAGVESPKITVKNLCYSTLTQSYVEASDEEKNVDYDPLTQTFTARGVKVLGSGQTSISTVSFTYKATDGTTRTVNVKIQIVKPVAFLKQNEYKKIGYKETYEDLNGEKIYIPKTADISDIGDFVKAIPAVVNTFNEYGWIHQGSHKESEIYKFVVNEPSDWSFSVDNKKMLNVKSGSSGDTISWANGYSLSEAKAGDTVTVTAKHKQGFEVSYTLVITDALPQVSKSGMGTDTFKYPSDNKDNQFITFDNIVDITNLPEDWKVVPYVYEASDNVKYESLDYEILNEQGTVDATGIKIVKGSNGHYSISGIEVATASKVEQETYINIIVVVFDKVGNLVGGSLQPIKLSINGEKGKNDVLSMTVNGITKSISAGETADFGKIYVPENASVTYSATGTGVFAEPAPSVTNSNCDEFTVADGKITAKALNKNGESKTVTFTFGTGSYRRTATAEIVVVKPVAFAPAYTGDGNIDVTGVTYYSVGNKVAQPALVTKTDENGKPDLNSGLVTGGFTLGKTTNNNTETYILQGISIDVTNEAVKNLPTVAFKNKSVTVDTSAKEAVFEDAFDIPSGDFTVECYTGTDTSVSYNQETNSLIVTIGGGIYNGKKQFLLTLRLKDANGNIISYSDDTFKVNFIDTIKVKMAKPSSGQFSIKIPYTDEIAEGTEIKATDFEEAPSGITINGNSLTGYTYEDGNIVVGGFWADETVADNAVLKFKLTVGAATKNIEVTFIK